MDARFGVSIPYFESERNKKAVIDFFYTAPFVSLPSLESDQNYLQCIFVSARILDADTQAAAVVLSFHLYLNISEVKENLAVKVTNWINANYILASFSLSWSVCV